MSEIKKLVSLNLAIVMALSLLWFCAPASARAEGTAEPVTYISIGGVKYDFAAAASGEGWSIEKNNGHVDLSGYNGGPIVSNQTLYIYASGANTVTGQEGQAGIDTAGCAYFHFTDKNSSLTVSGGKGAPGVRSVQTAIYLPGSISVTGGTKAFGDSAKPYVTIYGGKTAAYLAGADAGSAVTAAKYTDEAYFSAVQTTVTFSYYKNDGGSTDTDPSSTQVCDYDSVNAVPIQPPEVSREGYLLKGWDTSASSANARYAAGDKLIPSGDKNFYAVWQQLPASYVLLSDGGKLSASEIGADGNITLPSGSGANFVGWSEKNDYVPGTTAADLYWAGQSYKLASGTTLYAVYGQSAYYCLLGNGADGGKVGEAMSGIYRLPYVSELYTRDGYVGYGWNTKADGTGTHYYEGYSTGGGIAETLYAQWEKLPETGVVYHGVGGRVSSGGIYRANLVKSTAPGPADLGNMNFYRNDCGFLGWGTSENCFPETSATVEQGQVLELYAVWSIYGRAASYSNLGTYGYFGPVSVGGTVIGSGNLEKTVGGTGWSYDDKMIYLDGSYTGQPIYTDHDLEIHVSGNVTVHAAKGDAISAGGKVELYYGDGASLTAVSDDPAGYGISAGGQQTAKSRFFYMGTYGTLTASGGAGAVKTGDTLYLPKNSSGTVVGAAAGADEASAVPVTAYNGEKWLRVTPPDYTITYITSVPGGTKTSTAYQRAENGFTINADDPVWEGYVFLGWSIDGGNGLLYDKGDVIKPERDMTLRGRWTPADAGKIFLDGTQGTFSNGLSRCTVSVSDPLPAPTDANGTDFIGWAVGYTADSGGFQGWDKVNYSYAYPEKADGLMWDGQSYSAITPGTVLYAVWSTGKNEYLILNGNGGTFSGDQPKFAAKNSAVYRYASAGNLYAYDGIGTIHRDGYFNVGWNSSADGSGSEATGSSTGNYYAQWEAAQAGCAMLLAQGGLIPGGGTHVQTSDLSGGNHGITRPNFIFDGWYSCDTRQKATSLEAGKSYFAQWKGCAVTYYQAGGVEVDRTETAGDGSSVDYVPYYDGKTACFNGWNTKADGSGTWYWYGEKLNLTDNISLYPQLLPLSGNYLYLYGGTGAFAGQTYSSAAVTEFPAEITLPAAVEGKDLRGWFDGSNYYAPGEKITAAQSGIIRAVYAVSGDAGSKGMLLLGNGGTRDNKNFVYYNAASSNTDLILYGSDAFSRDGYVLSEWNTEPDGSGKAYAAGANMGDAGERSVGLLYAQWEDAAKVAVTFVNGASQDVQYVLPGAFTLPSKARAGYNLTGWNTAADGSGTNYPAGSQYNLTQAVTLYAQWTQKTKLVVDGREYDPDTEQSGTGWSWNCRALTLNGYNGGDIYAPNSSSIEFSSGVSTVNGTVDFSGLYLYVNEGASAVITAKAGNPALQSSGTIMLKGGGSLTVTGGSGAPAVEVGDDDFDSAEVENGSLTAVGGSGAPAFSANNVNWKKDCIRLLAGPDEQSMAEAASYNGEARVTASAVQLKLVLDGNGGTLGDEAQREVNYYCYDKNYRGVDLADYPFTREGFMLAGWSEKPNGAGTCHDAGDSVNNPGVKTVYAMWLKVPDNYAVFRINKNQADGFAGDAEPTVLGDYLYIAEDRSSPVTVPDAEISRINCWLSGWVEGSGGQSGNQEYVLPGESISPTKNTVFTGDVIDDQSRNEHVVVTRGNGGVHNYGGTLTDADSVLSAIWTDGSTEYLYNNFEMEGCTFSGWNTAPDGSGTAYAVNTPIKVTEDMPKRLVLYAQWIKEYLTIGGVSYSPKESHQGYAAAGSLLWDFQSDSAGGRAQLKLYGDPGAVEYYGVLNVNFDYWSGSQLTLNGGIRAGGELRLSYNNTNAGLSVIGEPGKPALAGTSVTVDGRGAITLTGGSGAAGAAAKEMTLQNIRLTISGTPAVTDGCRISHEDGVSVTVSADKSTLATGSLPCTVNLNGNGGSFGGQDNIKLHIMGGDKTALFDRVPVRDGYAFTGWKKQEGQTWNDYSAVMTGQYEFYGSEDLYAGWGPAEENAVTLVAGQAPAGMSYSSTGCYSLPISGGAALPTAFTDASLIPLLWHTADYGRVYAPGAVVTEPCILYPDYGSNAVILHYNGVSGQNGMIVKHGGSAASFWLPDTATDRNGVQHSVLSWNTRRDGSGTAYQPGSRDISAVSPRILFAQWQPCSLTLSDALGTRTVGSSGGDVYLLGYKRSVSGKFQTGWNTKADGSGIAYGLDEVLSYTDIAGLPTLYAVYVNGDYRDFVDAAVSSDLLAAYRGHQGSVLYAAQYDADGRMLEIKPITPDADGVFRLYVCTRSESGKLLCLGADAVPLAETQNLSLGTAS